MELNCVNGPDSPLLVPRHETRKATWIMHWGLLDIPLCDDCKTLMEPWQQTTWEKIQKFGADYSGKLVKAMCKICYFKIEVPIELVERKERLHCADPDCHHEGRAEASPEGATF